MFGMGMGMGMGTSSIIRHHINVRGKTMDLDAVRAFINDLYANAGLEVPNEFNPVDEVIRVVETLRKQGANHGRKVDSEGNQETGIAA